MMAGELHNKLVGVGAGWARRNGFGVVVTETSALGIREVEDVVAFRANCSAIIECKASRSDFLVDRHKPHRRTGGVGNYRFYLCQEGIILPEDLPPKWGLLWLKGRSVVVVKFAGGNLWPNPPPTDSHWNEYWHESNLGSERRILFSYTRRKAAKVKPKRATDA